MALLSKLHLEIWSGARGVRVPPLSVKKLMRYSVFLLINSLWWTPKLIKRASSAIPPVWSISTLRRWVAKATGMVYRYNRSWESYFGSYFSWFITRNWGIFFLWVLEHRRVRFRFEALPSGPPTLLNTSCLELLEQDWRDIDEAIVRLCHSKHPRETFHV